MGLFVLGIQVDADTDGHCYERIMLFKMDAHRVQFVVVQDAVVDPLGCRPVVVDFFPLCCSLWNRRVKADVPIRLGMDGPAIFGFRAGTVAVVHFFQSKRAAPFDRVLALVITPAYHAVPGFADGRPVCIGICVPRDAVREAVLRV